LSAIFFLAAGLTCEAQHGDPTRLKAERFILEYMYLSRLGPGYARDMNDETAQQFRALFSPDALLRWDLNRSPAGTIDHLLTPGEYTDLARETYDLRQPVLLFGEPRIRLFEGGKSATIYLRKLNIIMSPDDRPLYANRIDLQVSANLAAGRPLITDISKDIRPPVIRSLFFSLNFPAYSSAPAAVAQSPCLAGASGVEFTRVEVKTGKAMEAGMGLDLNLNRNEKNILIFSTGICYSQFPVFSKVTGYSLGIPDTVAVKSGNPLACTAFERSRAVHEKVLVRKIEVPLSFKSYINRWLYIMPGVSVGYATGKSNVVYMLSRTGGGLVTELGSQQQYYLDREQELDQPEYGYYRDKHYHFPKKQVIGRMILSFRLAAGFEKRFSDLSISVEPNAVFGMNPLVARPVEGTYKLDRVKDFHSFLQLVSMPAYDFSIGIRIVVSYLFKRD